MRTIAEVPQYVQVAEKLLSEAERHDIISYLSEHPKNGGLMEGTGGARKLRWRRGGQSKSGGVRVIYYYHDDAIAALSVDDVCQRRPGKLDQSGAQ